MVANAVRSRGGHVGVESLPGRGTTFRLLLPRSIGPRKSLRTTIDTSRGALQRHLRIVLLDDDALRSRSAARALHSKGDVTVTAATETAMHEHMADELPDLLIVEGDLESADAEEICRRMRSRFPHSPDRSSGTVS